MRRMGTWPQSSTGPPLRVLAGVGVALPVLEGFLAFKVFPKAEAVMLLNRWTHLFASVRRLIFFLVRHELTPQLTPPRFTTSFLNHSTQSRPPSPSKPAAKGRIGQCEVPLL